MATLLRDTVSFSKQFNDAFPTIIFSAALCTFPAVISYLFLTYYGHGRESKKPSVLPIPAVESWIPWIGKSVQLMRDPLTFIVESRYVVAIKSFSSSDPEFLMHVFQEKIWTFIRDDHMGL
jgi:hypothetical protein